MSIGGCVQPSLSRGVKRAVACVIACAALASPYGAPRAGEVEIVDARLKPDGAGVWRADVTLRHDDTGWDHYADAWRVVDMAGNVLGTRTLYHPHVDEQPFTRSLGGIAIPAGTGRVQVEAHDSVHGWSPARHDVDLQ